MTSDEKMRIIIKNVDKLDMTYESSTQNESDTLINDIIKNLESLKDERWRLHSYREHPLRYQCDALNESA